MASNTLEDAAMQDREPSGAHTGRAHAIGVPDTLRKWGSRGRKRVLRWAQSDKEDSHETSKRTYAVKEMYPRIFYAFSDVVVFVLDKSKCDYTQFRTECYTD